MARSGLVVEADGDELRQRGPGLVEHTERAVASVGDDRGGLDDASQSGGQIQVPAQADHGFEELSQAPRAGYAHPLHSWHRIPLLPGARRRCSGDGERVDAHVVEQALDVLTLAQARAVGQGRRRPGRHTPADRGLHVSAAFQGDGHRPDQAVTGADGRQRVDPRSVHPGGGRIRTDEECPGRAQ